VKITLASDGRQLALEYLEAPEPGAERFFHYVISVKAETHYRILSTQHGYRTGN